jgi:hypothetical protein
MKRKLFGIAGALVILLALMVLVGCPTETEEDITYTEGDVVVQGNVLHYYFSTSVEGLQKAVDDNHITLNPPLKNATWVLNPNLDNNVKQAMASKNASYCGTLYSGYLVANKKVDNNYYSTVYN